MKVRGLQVTFGPGALSKADAVSHSVFSGSYHLVFCARSVEYFDARVVRQPAERRNMGRLLERVDLGEILRPDGLYVTDSLASRETFARFLPPGVSLDRLRDTPLQQVRAIGKPDQLVIYRKGIE